MVSTPVSNTLMLSDISITENGETVLKIERSKFRTAEMASKYGALCPQHFLTLFEALTIHRLMQCDSIERCSKPV